MTKLSNFIKKDIEILIVEDEPIIAIGMECSLIELGYEVSGIESTARDAIKHAKEETPDLILMDINLKGDESGIQAAKQIWESNKIPVIFLTSYSDDKTIKNAMQSEPYGYLVKPCRDKELKASIEIALHKHNYFYKNKDSLNMGIDNSNLIKLENNFTFNKAKGVLYLNDKAVKLTKNEVKIFDILIEYRGETVSFDKISNYIWREPISDMGKLRNLVYRIKSKLKTDFFENVYELGYKLR